MVRVDDLRDTEPHHKAPRLEAHLRGDRRPTGSLKEQRCTENDRAVGGMRNPAMSVARVPGLRATGLLVNRALSGLLDQDPTIQAALLASITEGTLKLTNAMITTAAATVGAALGAADIAVGPRSMWRPSLVEAFVKHAGDPDTALAGWLRNGSPTGVAVDIEPCGVFPLADAKGEAHDELWRHWACVEPTTNYKSVHENAAIVNAEVDRLAGKGFVTKCPTWADVKRRFGNVVVSKVAAITKLREDGTTKLRLIIDMLRSGVNAHVRLHERIVLPRIVDLLADLLALLGSTDRPADIDMFVLDWADAFHSMGVLDSEMPHQIVKGDGASFVGYETVLFGGAGSPGVWGRAAAFLGRSGQALAAADAARTQIYVDDPWSAWSGSRAARERGRCVLLLWWLAVGPPISWGKVQLGTEVRWIGVMVRITGSSVALRLCDDFVLDLKRDVLRAASVTTLPEGDVRRLAGKAEWAAGVVPYMKPFVGPLWAAAAAARGGFVATARFRHSLRWLSAFLDKERGTHERIYHPHDSYSKHELVMELDASPWGLGGVLYENGKATRWFGEPISKLDVERFGIVIGDCRFQALLETLVILVAVRVWAADIGVRKWCVTCRGDSQAALGAVLKLRSKDPKMNEVVRELALDLAELVYEVDFFAHIPGRHNLVGDALSRLYEPGAAQALPKVLDGATRSVPAARSPGWWRTAAAPGPRKGEEDAAQTETADGDGCVTAGFGDSGVTGGVGSSTGTGDFGARQTAAAAGRLAGGIGMPWDVLRGGGAQDVRAPASRRELRGQLARTRFSWWAPECRSFSRARGRPIPGASSWPPALRSAAYPHGLPGLTASRRQADHKKVEDGNAVAEVTTTEATAAHHGGREFAMENPADSYFWLLLATLALKELPGVHFVIICNCMFAGGRRRKRTGILTNCQALVDALQHKMCGAAGVCDRTGKMHRTWTPVVEGGQVVSYPTAAESGYPRGLNALIAEVIAKGVEQRRQSKAFDFEFSEVFSGRRARLTRAVAAALGVEEPTRIPGSPSCSSCSSEPRPRRAL